MNKILICPFCEEIVKRDMDCCPRCGASRETMENEIAKRKNAKDDKNIKQDNFEQLEKDSVTTNNAKDSASVKNEANENAEIVKKNKRNMSQDVDGKIDIKTDDVTVLPASYSIKQARGDKPDKPKWWEFYKQIDIILARRKIMKEVNLAGREYPQKVQKWKLLLITIFLGYLGVQNFYAKNYKKGIWQLGLFTVAIAIANMEWDFLTISGLKVLIAGTFGFLCFYWWFADILAIVFNRFTFWESKMKFVAKLNYNTRRKLGKRYAIKK